MSADFQHINLAYLEQMTEGDQALERDMLRVLVKELQIEVPRMRALHAAGSWRQLAEGSHRLKTSMAYAGNAAMTDTNGEIELLANRGGGGEQLAALLDRLEAALPPIIAELQAAAEQLGPKS